MIKHAIIKDDGKHDYDGQAADRYDAVVYLDGKRLHGCFEADVDQGYVRAYKLCTPAGADVIWATQQKHERFAGQTSKRPDNYIAVDENHQPIVELRHGEVQIERETNMYWAADD